MNEPRVLGAEMYVSSVWSEKDYETSQVKSSSPSLACEMILIEKVADSFFASLEFLSRSCIPECPAL